MSNSKKKNEKNVLNVFESLYSVFREFLSTYFSLSIIVMWILTIGVVKSGNVLLANVLTLMWVTIYVITSIFTKLTVEAQYWQTFNNITDTTVKIIKNKLNNFNNLPEYEKQLLIEISTYANEVLKEHHKSNNS